LSLRDDAQTMFTASGARYRIEATPEAARLRRE
jgi:hypothetical protein